MLDADMLRAGLAGRPPPIPATPPALMKELNGLGEALGAGMDVTFPEGWRGMAGMAPDVGVGWGVEAAEFARPTEIGAGVFLALTVAAVG